ERGDELLDLFSGATPVARGLERGSMGRGALRAHRLSREAIQKNRRGSRAALENSYRQHRIPRLSSQSAARLGIFFGKLVHVRGSRWSIGRRCIAGFYLLAGL